MVSDQLKNKNDVLYTCHKANAFTTVEAIMQKGYATGFKKVSGVRLLLAVGYLPSCS